MTDVATLPMVFLFNILLRWCISLGTYSGAKKPPLFGDFEAQRHWMEITYNLPVQQWYENSTDNDLQYWGLDYPPLTAYHSWLSGFMASKINSSWVVLYDSRGLEDLHHKLFMRTTVLIADIIIYFSAVFVYFKTLEHIDSKSKIFGSLVMLVQPGLMLIDHGHFQYNSISLGLVVWGVVGLSSGHDLLGSVAFVLALNYKQMELYHALPFFCYLFGSCFRSSENPIWKLVKLGVTVLLAFAVCWFPFLHSKEAALQVLHRIFPVARGLYEDKVANIWCSISPVIKLKQLLPPEQLVLICLGTTLVALTVHSIHLTLRPTIAHFKVALVNSSLIFFLFSFQAHEKSVLIPALAVCLLLPDRPFESIWFITIASFSMVPLLAKDGLMVQYVACSLLWLVISWAVYSPTQPHNRNSHNWPHSNFFHAIFVLSLLGCALLTFGHIRIKPPKRYPDFFPLLIAIYSCVHFVGFLVFYHWLQLRGISSQHVTRMQYAKKKRH